MRRFLAFIAFFPPFAVQAQMAGWTPELLRVFTASCREAIVDNALRDAAARKGAALDEITSGKRAEFEKAIEPWLKPCACLTERVSSKWTFDDYTANRKKYQPEIQGYFKSGSCAVEVPKRSP